MNRVRSSAVTPKGCIIAEGETDGALLSRLAPEYDVLILPAGAKHWTEEMTKQVEPYAEVLVGTDDDEAGDEGAQKILSSVPKSLRLRPPENDWCESYLAGALAAGLPEPEARPRLVYTVDELLVADLGDTADNNWFENGIAPVGGEIVIHGPMKSLKSVLLMEMLRAMATGTEFAGYVPFVRSDGPGRCLLFQFEVSPQAFQNRMAGMCLTMSPTESAMFRENVLVYQTANGRLPRLKITRDGFVPEILAAVEEAEADVVAFDPIQRMMGGGDIDKPNELEPIFELYETLMDRGITVVYTHHNNKAQRNEATAYSMSGSQRLGADADSICSVYRPKEADDSSTETVRNFVWTLRNGVASGRSITARPSPIDPTFMVVHYDDPVTSSPAPKAAPVTSTATTAGMPSIT